VTDPDPRPTAVDWLLVTGACVIAAMVAVLTFFHLPWYVGAVPLPLSVLVAALAAWFLPRACFRLTGSMLGAFLPITVWFVTTAVLYLLPAGLYPLPIRIVLAPWRVLLLVGVGCLTGAVSISLAWGDQLRRKYAPKEADEPEPDREEEPAG
jgi:hypothetical protein